MIAAHVTERNVCVLRMTLPRIYVAAEAFLSRQQDCWVRLRELHLASFARLAETLTEQPTSLLQITIQFAEFAFAVAHRSSSAIAAYMRRSREQRPQFSAVVMPRWHDRFV